MASLISLFFISTIIFIVLYLLKKRNLEKLTFKNELIKKEKESIAQEIKKLNEEYQEYSGIKNIKRELKKLENQKDEFKNKYKLAQDKYIQLLKTIDLYQEKEEGYSFGLYDPIFGLEDSESYKTEIKKVRSDQKEMIKEKEACECETDWEVGGSKAEGRKFTNRIIKMSLRAFNGECDSLISKVKWNNINQFEDRINKAFESINKLNESNRVVITLPYLEIKIQELKLVHEQKIKDQEEKEEQREIKERMREEEKAKREYEKAQRDAEREELQYQKALDKARKEFETSSIDDKSDLEAQIEKLKTELENAHDKRERAISMAQQTRRGYVYVISNIGSFGENVYKIGMTRRLEPMDRVKELGDASVPFIFDVHAMIFSEDAPKLEKDLHKIFEKKRKNLVNYRKEFFNVSLDEIETEIENIFDATIEFTKTAEAKDYRESIEKLKVLNKASETIKKEIKDTLLDEIDI